MGVDGREERELRLEHGCQPSGRDDRASTPSSVRRRLTTPSTRET